MSPEDFVDLICTSPFCNFVVHVISCIFFLHVVHFVVVQHIIRSEYILLEQQFLLLVYSDVHT
jgi:hypothetical protein